MTRMSVSPKTAKPGELLDVDAWCMEARAYELEMWDSTGRCTTRRSVRALKDGSFRAGVTAPVALGKANLRLRPSSKSAPVFAEVAVTVKS